MFARKAEAKSYHRRFTVLSPATEPMGNLNHCAEKVDERGHMPCSDNKTIPRPICLEMPYLLNPNDVANLTIFSAMNLKRSVAGLVK